VPKAVEVVGFTFRKDASASFSCRDHSRLRKKEKPRWGVSEKVVDEDYDLETRRIGSIFMVGGGEKGKGGLA